MVSLLRWPGKVAAGSTLDQIMTVMDVFPTLAAATGVEPKNTWQFDGINMWPAIERNEKVKREGFVYFGSEIPLYGSFNFTAFDDQWKLVQWLEQDLTEIRIKNELFNIQDDPGEYHDLAAQYPDRVQEMAAAIKTWRSLYPINGVRARISAPPGWRAPWIGRTILVPMTACRKSPRKVWRQTSARCTGWITRWGSGGD